MTIRLSAAVFLFAFLANGPISAEMAESETRTSLRSPAMPLDGDSPGAAHGKGPGSPLAYTAQSSSYGMTVMGYDPDWDYIEQSIRSGAVDPMVSAARSTSEWIIAGSRAMAEAAEEAGEWIKLRSDEAIDAAWDATGWMRLHSENAVSAARDAGDWVVSSSSSAMNNAGNAALTGYNSFSILQDWSDDVVDGVKERLRAQGASEFALLVDESGFALVDVQVSVGLIPGLTVSFRHDRNLSSEELAAFSSKVDDYAERTSGIMAFFEVVLLRKLAQAGEYSGNVRLSGIDVNIFPLPALVLSFDPFRYTALQNQTLDDAYSMTQVEAKKIENIEDRITKIESRIFNRANSGTAE